MLKQNDEFKQHLLSPDGRNFCISLMNLLFTEQNLKVKEELSECICDFMKGYDEEIQDIFVDDGNFIARMIEFLNNLVNV